MDARAELNKLWKDLQESAREFASFGLESASRALDFTATTLKRAEDQLRKQAEKFAPKAEDGAATTGQDEAKS